MVPAMDSTYAGGFNAMASATGTSRAIRRAALEGTRQSEPMSRWHNASSPTKRESGTAAIHGST